MANANDPGQGKPPGPAVPAPPSTVNPRPAAAAQPAAKPPSVPPAVPAATAPRAPAPPVIPAAAPAARPAAPKGRPPPPVIIPAAPAASAVPAPSPAPRPATAASAAPGPGGAPRPAPPSVAPAGPSPAAKKPPAVAPPAIAPVAPPRAAAAPAPKPATPKAPAAPPPAIAPLSTARPAQAPAAAKASPPGPAARSPATDAAAAAAPAQPQTSGLTPEALDDLLRRTSALDTLDYFEVLKVDQSAAPADIKRAFYQESRTYHPDRFFHLADQDLKERVNDLYKRVTEAYFVLRDETRRKKYTADVTGPERAQKLRFTEESEVETKQAAKKAQEEQIGTHPKGRQFFQTALADIEAQRWSQAERNLKMALTYEPQNARYKERLTEVQQKAYEASREKGGSFKIK